MNARRYSKFCAFNSKEKENRPKNPLIWELHFSERNEGTIRFQSYIRCITEHMVSTQYMCGDMGDSNIITHLVHVSLPPLCH